MLASKVTSAGPAAADADALRRAQSSANERIASPSARCWMRSSAAISLPVRIYCGKTS
jgi:hypothetical protein